MKEEPVMIKDSTIFVGLDLGDKASKICILDEAGEVVEESRIPTTPTGLKRKFSCLPRCRGSDGGRDPFALGQSAAERDGARGAGCECAEVAIDLRERAQRGSSRCGVPGAASAFRSEPAIAHTTQRPRGAGRSGIDQVAGCPG